MNWRLWGPLVFATILFVVGSTIKTIAFGDDEFYVDLAPELALWATGVLFSFAVSEQALFGGRTVYDVRRTSSGTGFHMDFKVSFPEKVEFSPRMIYLFVFVMALWILTLVLTEKASAMVEAAGFVEPGAGALLLVALTLAGGSVGIALRAIREVG